MMRLLLIALLLCAACKKDGYEPGAPLSVEYIKADGLCFAVMRGDSTNRAWLGLTAVDCAKLAEKPRCIE